MCLNRIFFFNEKAAYEMRISDWSSDVCSSDHRLTNAATRGQPLALSIYARVQGVLESELGNAVTNLEAIGGAGIILDVHTGEVLAMTSLPTYNPNKLVPDNGAARRNAVTYNLYELGSTFKPLTIGAAIDNGVVTSMAKIGRAHV